MNKKGFTLVELLAVIAILAILVIIAMPNVLSMFNSAKENTFITEVETIYKNAQQQYISDTLTGGTSTKTYTTEGTSPKPLELTTTKRYEVTVSRDGVTKLAVWDDAFYFNGSSSDATTPMKQITDIKTIGAQDNPAGDVTKCSATDGVVTCLAN